MNDEILLIPGEMVAVNLEGLTYSEDGFAMGGSAGRGGLALFEEINLQTYPSCNDFRGKRCVVYHGDVAIIVRYVGRPFQINHDPDWFSYDVYEIIVRGFPCQIFRQNLLRVDPTWIASI